MTFIIAETLLPKRYERAKKLISDSEGDLQELINSSPGNVYIPIRCPLLMHFFKSAVKFDEHEVVQWLQKEQQATTHSTCGE